MTYDFPYIVKLGEGQMEELLRAKTNNSPITLRLEKYTDGMILMRVFVLGKLRHGFKIPVKVKDAYLKVQVAYPPLFKEYHYISYTPGDEWYKENGEVLYEDVCFGGTLILYKHKAELIHKDGKFIFH